MGAITGLATEARQLTASADRLRAGVEVAAGSAVSEDTRATLARVADRLSASVTRPLTATLQTLLDPSGSDAFTNEADIAEELHRLAVDATRLRVRAPAAPALQEATAALQDLACQAVAGDPERLEARRSELAALMGGLSPRIQLAPNGPYLVSNVPVMTDWLGVTLTPTPQVALCRCGASMLKPWCDGSHSQIGFDDAKSDSRVPDQLDHYRGIGVRIADNRGTCAHSGFCTDRLPTVFRAQQEPFVAAAGGRVDEILRAGLDCPSGALSVTTDDTDPVGRSDSERQPAIEISKDGPYRVTGRVELLDADGRVEARNDGASLEHYSLCRCGRSQNKPFCSGMHWYADFHDPPPPEQATLFQWAGGFPALLRLTRRFYEVHVPTDPQLSALFGQMSPDHPQRVASWLGQVFGGPPAYSDRYGEYDRMISQHLDKALTPEQRARWVLLLARSADEVGLPADAEFRAAFTAYLEWGSRIALENSQPGVHPPPHMPVPRWWWVCDAEPWSRFHATKDALPEEPPPSLPDADEPLSFEVHIRSLFRGRDRDSMRFAFDLWSHDDVGTHADAILERLRAGTMPCDGAWPPERITVFERWVSTGKPA